MRPVKPAGVDHFDGDHLNWCGSFRVIATPGHTLGSKNRKFYKVNQWINIFVKLSTLREDYHGVI